MTSDFERGWRAACARVTGSIDKMLKSYDWPPRPDDEPPSAAEMELARVKGTVSAIADQCPQEDTCVIRRSPPSSPP